jgi:hypothetical protein
MTLEVVLFDDVELVVTSALRTALTARAETYTDGVYVSISSPTDPATGEPETPARMVTIRRDGGPRLDPVRDEARIGVNVWAATEQDCNDLARMVAALLWAMPDGDPIIRVDQTSGPSVIADDRPHRYLTFDVLMRGTDA